MAIVAFNTYDFVKSLEDAGMDEKHAAAISAGILRAHEIADLATKADLRELQASTKAEMRELQAQMEAKIDKVEAKLEKETSEIKGEIKLLKWMLGIILGGMGSLIAMGIGLIIKAFFGT